MQNNDALWAHIKPNIRNTIEELAQQSRETRKRSIYIGLGASLILFLFLKFIGLIVGLIAAVIYYLVQHSKLNNRYKREIVPKLIATVWPNATWVPEGSFDKEIIDGSGLFDVGFSTRFHSEDTIVGRIDKTDFTYSDVTISHTQNGKNGTHEVIDFKGFVFHADFNKSFDGLTMLSSDRTHLSAQVGLFSSLKRCHLENIQFETTYRVYTSNDQEARYILSPALQQRILSTHVTLQRGQGCQDLHISFHNNKMLIMVTTNRNNFEVKYKAEEVEKDLLTLKALTQIVETLNLNTRIWTKE